MQNYKFIILIRQDFRRYYIADIMLKSIHKGCVSDNEGV